MICRLSAVFVHDMLVIIQMKVQQEANNLSNIDGNNKTSR